MALEDGQLSHVIGAETANEMWSKLKGYHERGSLCNKIHVLRKLCSMRLSEGGDMSKHLVELSELVHKLLGMGEKLGEHWIVAILLSSLPETYNPLITALEGRSEDELKLDYVKGKLLDEWRRRCENQEENEERALRATMRRSDIRNGATTVGGVCYYCREEGHYRRDCPKLSDAQRVHSDRQRRERGYDDRDGGPRGISRGGQFDSGRYGSGGSDGNQVCFTTMVKNGNESHGWIIDSGCSKHMTGNLEILEKPIAWRELTNLADGRNVPVTMRGTARFTGLNMRHERMDVKLKDVLYVPELKLNVLSVSRMIDEGYTVSFVSNGCKIMNGTDVVLMGERRGEVFYVKQP